MARGIRTKRGGGKRRKRKDNLVEDSEDEASTTNESGGQKFVAERGTEKGEVRLWGEAMEEFEEIEVAVVVMKEGFRTRGREDTEINKRE